MENMQFKSDDNSFQCVECGSKITVEYADASRPRPITCEKCGTEFEVLKRTSGPGLQVLLKTASEPEAVAAAEAELEDEDIENPDDEEQPGRSQGA